ncbi:hypothetical protein [Hyphomicrobium sp. 99]|uniref:hypothetical protein n=1 Tax=Hyphomicrobium sp. 99 TaxID=1163419 RepID=UPI0005F87B25|nr:hypothetical protein [Hyphomicrobium sp. 99]
MNAQVKRLFALLTGLLMSAMLASVSIAASDFQGTWKVKDTSGKPFEITLAVDGKAKATLPKEGMTGTWKEESDAAVITWDTGWTTRISRSGSKFTKSAFKKGERKPVNSTDAEKIQ